MTHQKRMFLIAEFCAAEFYNGWHLYLRDSDTRLQRNADGGWGWLRGKFESRHARTFLATLGIHVRGDGTCDDDGYAEVAKRFPISRQRIGGKPRGCIPVDVDEYGVIAGVADA